MSLEPYLHAHAAQRNNPHHVTAEQIGAIPLSDLPTIEANILSIVANDNLNAFDPITITGYHANSGNTAHLGKVIGVVLSNTNIGFAGNVITSGLVKNAAWNWTGGSPIFLNGTVLSQSPPATGFIQQIGVAKSSDTIYIDLSDPVKL